MSAEIKPEIERVYSTTEAKNNLSAILNFVEGPGEAAIIESHGRPRAAVISIDDLAALRKFKAAQRREDAWRRLEALRKEVSARNADLAELSDDELDEFVGESVRDAFHDLVESGRIKTPASIAK